MTNEAGKPSGPPAWTFTDEELDLIWKAVRKQLFAMKQAGIPDTSVRKTAYSALDKKLKSIYDRRHPAKVAFEAIRAERKRAALAEAAQEEDQKERPSHA